MRAGRGIRAAAVLTVGLVGLAVIAPGLASAETTTPAVTCATGQVQDASGSCVPATEGSTAPVPDTGSTVTVPSTSEQTSTTTGGGSGSSGTGATSPAVPSAPTASGDSAANPGAAAAKTVPPENTTPAVRTPAVVPDTPAAVSNAATALTGAPATGTSLADVMGNLPTGNLTGLPTIPDLPADGNFATPQDACVYLASKVKAPAGQEGVLGGQFTSFCQALPSSFDSLDLTGLISKLTDLLAALKATPTPSGSARTTPIHTARGDLPGSFHDLDCAQLTYDEAQAVLADDPSDPNHLDGDHDGIACERNPHDYRTVCDDYDGYPVGAVATGDSAPVVAPGVATALGGLALAAVAGAGVTPAEPEDAPDRAADDLLTAEEH